MTTKEFKAYIIPYYRDMYRIAASVMKSGDEAADAVQDAMLKLWDRRDQLDEVTDLKAYCLNTIRNVCLNIISRKRHPSDSEIPLNIESGEDVHADIEWKDMMGCVNEALNRLPDSQKSILKLSAFGGFSNTEIAELLGLSGGNVRVLLFRARGMLKKLLSSKI